MATTNLLGWLAAALALGALAGGAQACGGGATGAAGATAPEGSAAPASPANEAAGGAGACPAAWLAPAQVDPSIAPPAGAGSVVLHAKGVGTQDYVCKAAADGGTGWALQGPTAELDDCHGAVVGHHFASDAGTPAPEWQTRDGAFVTGRKVAAFTPDGGGASVPWLLLQGVDHGGAGPLGRATYVQRVATDGGVAPGACDAGDTQRVPYRADYYFYGP